MGTVLVAVDPRMYGEVLLLALLAYHPDTESLLVEPEALDEMVVSLVLRLVVGSRTTRKVREMVPFWVEVATHDGLDAEGDVGGRRLVMHDVSIEDVVSILDQTEGLWSPW